MSRYLNKVRNESCRAQRGVWPRKCLGPCPDFIPETVGPIDVFVAVVGDKPTCQGSILGSVLTHC